jgi:O-antigen ligase
MEMYGITKGVLFGNLWAAAFNTMPLALFVVFMHGVSEKKTLHLIICVITFFLIMLTLRRTVIVLSTLGILICLLTLMTREKAKMLFMAGGIIAVIGFFVYNNTDFFQEFKERIELRKLDERDLAEEKRMFEYSLLYDDMFVYNAYSPWFGYELFNSAGNYGKGVLADRSLHGDIPNIWHSSGLIGVMLYLLMIGTAFMQAFRAARRYQHKLLFLFCGISFAAYTGSGRYTEVAATLLLFLIVMSPMATSEEPVVEPEENKSALLKIKTA